MKTRVQWAGWMWSVAARRRLFQWMATSTFNMITGRGGQTLNEKWQSEGTKTFLGIHSHGFPNLFIVTGPQGGGGSFNFTDAMDWPPVRELMAEHEREIRTMPQAEASGHYAVHQVPDTLDAAARAEIVAVRERSLAGAATSPAGIANTLNQSFPMDPATRQYFTMFYGVLDLDRPHLTPIFDVYSHLVYAAGRSDVETTMIHGQIVMQGRQLTTLDEASIMAEVHEIASRITR